MQSFCSGRLQTRFDVEIEKGKRELKKLCRIFRGIQNES